MFIRYYLPPHTYTIAVLRTVSLELGSDMIYCRSLYQFTVPICYLKASGHEHDLRNPVWLDGSFDFCNLICFERYVKSIRTSKLRKIVIIAVLAATLRLKAEKH